MPKAKDPVDVVAAIRTSIEASSKGSRRVRAHRLRDQFGFHNWTEQRKVLVAQRLEEQGIRAEPPIAEAGLDDWVVLSLPIIAVPSSSVSEAWPSADWFDHMVSLRLDSEREVEMHFVGPLFHAMGYEDEQEAVGFGFTMWEGVSKKRVQADLVYFGNEVHSIDEGAPLVLVEAKGPSQEPHAGTGQAKSYAYWLKPAYYVTTNGNVVCVYDYQGGAVPDAKVLEFERSDLQTQFEVLRQLLNPAAASAARKQKTERLMKNAPSA